MLKTHTRKVITLPIGEWVARETIWWNPATAEISPSPALRGLVAPACNYGYDVVVFVGQALFVDAQPVGHIVSELARHHVHLSASTVSELGRRFIALLALAHRQCAPRLQQAMALQGGYILHLDATYEDKSPLLMTGIDAVMEIVLGNIKLPSEKAEGIVPFLRQLQQAFGPPLALVHDMSKGIQRAIEEVFPGIPDYICHFHFLRDLGKDLLGGDYDRLRQRLQTHGTVGALRARLRNWQRLIDAAPALRQTLHQLPASGLPTQPQPHAPLLAAYLLAHWVLAGRQQGHGYGFPFDRPLLATARRAQEVFAQLEALLPTLRRSGNGRENRPLHQLRLELEPLVTDRPLRRTLDRLQSYSLLFDQVRQALRLAPVTAPHGLNHDGDPVEMKTLEQHVQAFAAEVRAHPDYATTPAWRKMIQQIDHYGPKLFAAPLLVSTPQGSRSLQPQRTNNLMERFFRDLKHDGRRRTGAHTLGRTLCRMLADTPLVKNLQNPDYLNILLGTHPNLEALFAEIDPATVRDELQKARQNPDKVPRALKRYIADLSGPAPIKTFIENVSPNRISRS